MSNKPKSGFYVFSFIILLFLALSFLTESCADNPSSLGKKFINPGDTQGVQVFDSYVDTMLITSSNLRYYVNTSSSINLMVGRYANYKSLALIKFDSITMYFDTATISSAVMKLKYKNYYFPSTLSDSLGNIGFDIYKVQNYYNYSTVTYDSINSTSFGTVSQGNYYGAPSHDTAEVDIPLNTSMVHDWLKYRDDTSYSAKNNGIVLMPNSSSRVIKGFYSSQTTYKPLLQITFSSNPDTLYCTQSETVFLPTATITNSPGTFKLFGGVGYVDVMRFDVSRFSPKVIVNDAQLILTLDPAKSVISPQTNQSVSAYFITDTLNNTENVAYTAGLYNNQFSIRMYLPFQRWIQGQTNYGMMIKTYNNSQAMDLFSIFSETYTDPSKRPRVIIKYSLRVP